MGDVLSGIARHYKGSLYPHLKHIRGATALRRVLEMSAYYGLLNGNQSAEYGFRMIERTDFRPLVFERPAVKRFASILKRNSTVLDIGSYHGFYAILAASQTDRNVYAFEPDEINRDRIERNLEANEEIAPVELVPKAIHDENTTISYDSFGPKTTVGMGKQEVKTITLDQFCSEHLGGVSRPDVIKIDVEGAESNVLKGATEVLTHKPTILLEIHHDPRADFDTTEAYRYLEDFSIEVLMERNTETIILANPNDSDRK